MDLINDVDLVAGGSGREFTGLPQLSHLLDAVVARAINLDHIERTPFGNLSALVVVLGEIDIWSVRAVQAFGENSGDGGFSGSAWATENVGVRDPTAADGIGQGLGHMFLPDHIGKKLRPVLSRNDLIRHGRRMAHRSSPMKKKLHDLFTMGEGEDGISQYPITR